MDISQVLFDFFGRRIAEHGLYNPVEYIAYGAIVIVLMFFVLFPLLDRRGVKFNSSFMLALLPYILLGSALRVLEDLSFLPRSWNPLELAYYFVTPGIWLLIAGFTLLGLFLALWLSKRLKKSFHKVFAAIGLVPAVPIVAFELLNFPAWLGVLAVLALVLITVAALAFIFKRLNWSILKSRLNILAVSSQALDGFATFVATQFFLCGEQHPLSGAILDFFPLSFVFVKIALVLVIISYVDKEIKNENLRGFIKVVVAILGFATGLRDVLTLGVGTCL
jgi:uncharacterized membrane protein